MILSTCKKVFQSHWLLSCSVILFFIATIAFTLLPPLLFAKIIDLLSTKQNITFLLMFSYFVFFLLESISTSIRDSLLIILSQKLTHALRSEMMHHFIKLDTGTITKQPPGAMTSRIIQDVDTLEELFSSGIISMIADACTLISILVVLFQKASLAFYLLLLLLPVVFLFTRFTQKQMLKSEIQNRKAIADANAILPDTINNLLMIQNLQAQPFMEDAYDQTIEQSYQALQKTNFYDAIYSPIILIINALTIGILILIATSPEFTIFSMSAGNAVMCMQYISKVFGPIESIGMEIQTIQSSIAGIHRIQDFFASEEKQAFQPVSNIQNTNPIISIQHLHFAYDTKEVLHDYNLEIYSGEQVTIQGRTGAGKSTLFKLILGLYKPDSGTVKVFDHDPSTFSPSIRRSIYGYVEQSFHLVRGTVKEQVSLFDPDITEKQIIHAYQIVGLWDTIQCFDQQLDTEYNNDLFSQGQKQLIAIARAIVLDPPLLLLDEITADLDTSTEQQVLLAIQNAMKDRTVISISHRTSAITGKVIEIHESASNEG